MDKLFGLPAHPFLVHIPVVLLPLAAVGVVVMAIKPAWHRRYRWAVLGVCAVGTIGIVLAASAGEELERRIINVEGEAAAASWERHSQLGETARNFGLVFFVIVLAFALVPWWLERRSAGTETSVDSELRADDGSSPAARRSSTAARALRIGVTVIALAAAAGSVVTVARAGHTGSKSVWNDYVQDKPAGG